MKMVVMAGLLLSLLALGCVSNGASTVDVMEKKDDSAMEKTDDAMVKDDSLTKDGDAMIEEGAMAKGIEYVPFSQSQYEEAKSQGKTIFLEFYANWCPICQAQAPALVSGLSKIDSSQLVAFRVNYKDSDTDTDETALAQKFNITYQHTHVVIDAQESIQLKSNESWSESDVIEKIGAFT